MRHSLKTTFATTSLLALLLLTPAPAQAANDADGDGVPNAAEPVLGTDPKNADTDGDGVNDLKDKNPVFAENPIARDGKPKAFKFTGQVEDNADPVTKKGVADHLELEVKNTSGQDMTEIAIYYTVKDLGTGKTEGYYKPLSGLTIKKGEAATIHFDDVEQANHFRDNPNSSYHKSENEKLFTVELAAAGLAPMMIEIHKDKGGAEQPD
jgi:hypothetical protein